MPRIIGAYHGRLLSAKDCHGDEYPESDWRTGYKNAEGLIIDYESLHVRPGDHFVRFYVPWFDFFNDHLTTSYGHVEIKDNTFRIFTRHSIYEFLIIGKAEVKIEEDGRGLTVTTRRFPKDDEQAGS